MGSINIQPSPRTAKSYGDTVSGSVSYTSVMVQSVSIYSVSDGFTAEFQSSAKTGITVTCPVNDTDSTITGQVVLTGFDTSSQSYIYCYWDIQVQPKDNNIKLTPQRVDTDGRQQTIYVSAQYSGMIQDSILLQNTASTWCDISFYNSAKTVIQIVMQANTTDELRSFRPNLWGMTTGGVQVKVPLPITQAPGANGSITITPTGSTQNWIGGTVTATVAIEHMVDIDVTTNQQDWSDVSLQGTALTITYLTNNDYQTKTALISVSGNDERGIYREATYTLTVIGKSQPGSISVEPTELAVDADSGYTATAQLTMNNILTGSISTGCSEDWLDVVVDEQTGEVSVTTLYSNPQNLTRTATVTISATENVWLEPVSCTILVTQEPGVDYTAHLEWLNNNWKTVDKLGDVWEANLICEGMDNSTVGFVGLPGWVGAVINAGYDKVTFTVGANTTQDTREGTFTLSGTSANEGINYFITYTIFQGANIVAETFPVWEDKMVELPTSQENKFYIPFRIVDTNVDPERVIFEGVVYNQTGNTFNITKVVKHFIQTTLEFTDGWQTDDEAYKYFRLDIQNEDETYFPFKLYKVFNDWSYKPVSGACISNQIIKECDNRQYFLMSFLNRLGDNPVTVTINGAGEVISDEIKHYIKSKPQTDVVVNGVTYKVSRTPYTYALYYRTKAGGWSWMLFNRTSKQTDKVTMMSYTKEIFSFSPLAHGKKVYGVDITSTWQLKSNFLSDKQSEQFQEIVASPTLWLHDLEKDEVIPVVMSTTKTEHLGWANNSKHKVRYTIEVESSRTKSNNA